MAQRSVFPLLSFSLLARARGPIEAVPAAHGGKAKAKGIAQLADFRFAAAVERRLSVELRNARGVALSRLATAPLLVPNLP